MTKVTVKVKVTTSIDGRQGHMNEEKLKKRKEARAKRKIDKKVSIKKERNKSMNSKRTQVFPKFLLKMSTVGASTQVAGREFQTGTTRFENQYLRMSRRV